MKWKLPILLIFLNVLLFGFVGYKLQNSHKEAIQKNIISEQIQRYTRSLELSSESQVYQPIFFIGKDTLNKITYTGKYPILICCFSVETCAPCYENMLEMVQEIFPDYKERDDIIFLSNDLEFRYRDSFHGKKIYSNTIDNPLKIDGTGAPYFFVLDKDLKTDLVMCPNKASPTMTKDYLTIVKNRLNIDY